MLSSDNAALLFLVRGGGIISKETCGGIESGAFPILELHLADEMNVRREMGAEGWVMGSIALWRQRQRALGSMLNELRFRLRGVL
jgi:hypothetical protein